MVSTHNEGAAVDTRSKNIATESPLPAPQDSKSNAATGASAAGVRAVSSQLIALYFRAPVKAFFRTRVEYVVVERNLNLQQHVDGKVVTW